MNAAVVCLDSAAQQTGVHLQDLPIGLSEADYAKYLKDGHPYAIQFPIVRGTSNIRFIVYDHGSDLVGRTDAKLF